MPQGVAYPPGLAGFRDGRRLDEIMLESHHRLYGTTQRTDDLATASAVEMAAMVREKRASPVEITEAVLARIAACEPKLNAFVGAGCGARPRRGPRGGGGGDARRRRSARCTACPPPSRTSRRSRACRPGAARACRTPTPATADAPLVARLRAAGAIILGKTTSTEHGWTAVSHNPLTGATHNPWQHGMTSGGSSSGAAALCGAGCGPLHLGTDGAGSIRLPAHFCGAVGFKPTYGRVPYAPHPNNGALSHAGPITRSVADAALMFSVMAGPHPLDHTTLGETVYGLRCRPAACVACASPTAPISAMPGSTRRSRRWSRPRCARWKPPAPWSSR